MKTTTLKFIKLSGVEHIARGFVRNGSCGSVLSSKMPDERKARNKQALKKLTDRELADLLGEKPHQRSKGAKIHRILELV